MNNGKEDVSLEVRSPGGELLFTVAVKGLELSSPRGRRGASTTTNGSGKPASDRNDPNHPTDKSHPNAQPMSDAQKRYLFRLLAEQGFEGDQASDHLKNLFRVDALKEVTKQEASRAIEQLLERSKGGKGNGSPVKQSN
jgi:hypothetical protein